MAVRTWLSCYLLALLGGCSGASPLAPQGGLVDPASVDQSNQIAYRTLTRSDFQATSPPADASPYAKRIGALTCARVMTTPDTSYSLREYRQPASVTYRGAFRVLAFQALMDRNCSWWNPQSSKLPEGYVLQHEQVHFALVELEARRMNARAPSIVRDYHVEGSSEAEVKHAIDDKLAQIMQQAIDRLLDVNMEFDEATSAKYAPAVQQQWFDRVQAELATGQGG